MVEIEVLLLSWLLFQGLQIIKSSGLTPTTLMSVKVIQLFIYIDILHIAKQVKEIKIYNWLRVHSQRI